MPPQSSPKVTSPRDGWWQGTARHAAGRAVSHKAVPGVMLAGHSWNSSCRHSTAWSGERVSRGTCATTKRSQLGKGEARKFASTALPCPANPRRNEQRQQGEDERMSLPPSLVVLWCHSSNTLRNRHQWEPVEVPGLCW